MVTQNRSWNIYIYIYIYTALISYKYESVSLFFELKKMYTFLIYQVNLSTFCKLILIKVLVLLNHDEFTKKKKKK